MIDYYAATKYQNRLPSLRRKFIRIGRVAERGDNFEISKWRQLRSRLSPRYTGYSSEFYFHRSELSSVREVPLSTSSCSPSIRSLSVIDLITVSTRQRRRAIFFHLRPHNFAELSAHTRVLIEGEGEGLGARWEARESESEGKRWTGLPVVGSRSSLKAVCILIK